MYSDYICSLTATPISHDLALAAWNDVNAVTCNGHTSPESDQSTLYSIQSEEAMITFDVPTQGVYVTVPTIENLTKLASY